MGVRGRSNRVMVIKMVRGIVFCVFGRRQGVKELFVFGEIVRVMA